MAGVPSVLRSPASVLQAASVAIVGASERAKWPSQIFTNLRQFGYGGRIHLVNPRQQSVFGERCVPTLRDIGEPVDHAMVIVPAANVAGVLTDAESAGVKSATIYAAAVGDGEGEASRERGAWLKNFVASSKLRVSGPNCMGSFSFRERLFAYPNTELCSVPPGPVGGIFQSGGTLQFWVKSAADRGIRFSYVVSSGNEVDLELADYLNFMVDDPHTKTIVVFIEGIRRPQAFMQAAGRALEAGKPVIAIKTGATQKSRAAARSHTGAIGGDYAAYLAMCERYGIVNCRSLDDLLETTLAFQGGRLPKGPRIGFVTTSGGTVDLLYDYAETEGAVIPEFSAATNAALLPHMQEGIAPKNPLDTGIPTTLKAAADQMEVVARDPNVDMVAWGGPLPGKSGNWDGIHEIRRLLSVTDKPIVTFGRMIYQMPPDGITIQEQAGIPFLQALEPTLRALNGLWFYAERTGRAPAVLPPAPPSDLTPDNLEATLGRYGINLPQSRAVTSAEQAADAAAAIGFPVVLKIRSADIVHKTEAGGVMLHLASRQQVLDAADALVKAARAAHPNAKIDGFLVQEMVSGVEMIVGTHEDPLYGPLLLVGAGGIMVELVRDVAQRLLPVNDRDVGAMIDSLKASRLIAGYRGRPAADRKALEATANALARFYLDHRARITEIEINPLIVRPNGAVAVDVRVAWREEKA
ncbi:MAG TPA: acetate--CoA ligase family protein [Xanthobacteraceae bacterium]|nr:acetate--CoA ligase family protein [Xanthobacteraceae bacterium]